MGYRLLCANLSTYISNNTFIVFILSLYKLCQEKVTWRKKITISLSNLSLALYISSQLDVFFSFFGGGEVEIAIEEGGVLIKM